MACYLYQSLYSYASSPGGAIHQDTILETPILESPENDSDQCVDTGSHTKGAGTGIVLTWQAVSGATFYIVQWCKNSSFHGPTLRAVTVAAPTVTYDMLLSDDIGISDQIHWRVMAYDGAGGVSQKSEAWNFKFECNDPNDKGGKGGGQGGSANQSDNLCNKYNVKMKIEGPDVIMCCTNEMFHAQYSHQCKNADGTAVATLTGAVWSIIQDPAAVVDNQNDITFQNDKLCTIKSNCKFSQKFSLVLTLTFLSPTDGVFSCKVTKKVTVDCQTGKPSSKPWLTMSSYCEPSLIYIHEAYSCDDARSGGSYIQDCEYMTNYTEPLPRRSLGRGADKEFVASGPVTKFLDDVVYCYQNTEDGCENLFIGYNHRIALQAEVFLPVPWDCEYIYKKEADSVEQGGLGCADGQLYVQRSPTGCLYHFEDGIGVYLESWRFSNGPDFTPRDGDVDPIRCGSHGLYFFEGCGLYKTTTGLHVYLKSITDLQITPTEVDPIHCYPGLGLYFKEGCGLYKTAGGLNVQLFESKPDALRCDPQGLFIEYGCGLHTTEDDGIFVYKEWDAFPDRNDPIRCHDGIAGHGLYLLEGCGLKKDTTGLKVKLDFDTTPGNNDPIKCGSDGLMLDIGCGLEKVAGGLLQVKLDHASGLYCTANGIYQYGFPYNIGCGLDHDGTALYVDTDEETLFCRSDLGLYAKLGCGLGYQQGTGGGIYVQVDENTCLYCDTGGIKLELGDSLECSDGLNVQYGCGFDIDSGVGLVHKIISTEGLDCKSEGLYAKIGYGLQFYTNDGIDGQLVFHPGCGLGVSPGPTGAGFPGPPGSVYVYTFEPSALLCRDDIGVYIYRDQNCETLEVKGGSDGGLGVKFGSGLDCDSSGLFVDGSYINSAFTAGDGVSLSGGTIALSDDVLALLTMVAEQFAG